MASKCASCVHEEMCRHKENMMKFEDHIKEQVKLLEFNNFSADVKCNNFVSKTKKEDGIDIPAFMRPNLCVQWEVDMKRKLLILKHQIAVKMRTYHSRRLKKWTEFDNNVCSKL